MDEQSLRALPSVEELASAVHGPPRHLVVAAAREQIAAARQRIRAGGVGEPGDLRARTEARAIEMARPSLRRVINATGVILHTNLGRAPLAAEAAEAAAAIGAGYSNLEYDIERGTRGSRHDHLEDLLCALTGAEAAIAVNNNAAAVMLALAALASGREVLVGRGQLVEIGGAFRVPEILEASGARLVEVGTTNRTRLADYEAAIGPDTAALLRVHQSNFRTVGFVEETPLPDLCQLARERGLGLIDDLGSGAIDRIEDESPIAESVAAGADLVCSSGDKLLGGPQAGILAGNSKSVERCRSHPLARAVRLDKLQVAALEATLRLHRDGGAEAIPALAMLAADDDELRARVERLARAIGDRASVARATARPGGGSLPLVELEGPVCEVRPGDLGAEELTKRLRRASPPVIARISEGLVVLDPRTMSDEDADLAARAVRDALV